MQVSLRVLLMANTLYSVAFKAAGQVVSVTRLNCRLTGGLNGMRGSYVGCVCEFAVRGGPERA